MRRRSSRLQKLRDASLGAQEVVAAADVTTTVKDAKVIVKMSDEQKQMMRCERALAQRLFLLGRRDSLEDYQSDQLIYIVMGTTGNIYYPTLSVARTSCSCIDQRSRKGLCKHLLFVLIRVLKFPLSHAIITRGDSAISQVDLDAIYKQATSFASVDSSDMAPDRVRSAFSVATGVTLDESKPEILHSTMRKLAPNDDCPICYEPMSSFDSLLFCRSSCRRAVHSECWSRWESQQKKNHELPSCVYCRSIWVNGDRVDQPLKRTRINLETYM